MHGIPHEIDDALAGWLRGQSSVFGTFASTNVLPSRGVFNVACLHAGGAL